MSRVWDPIGSFLGFPTLLYRTATASRYLRLQRVHNAMCTWLSFPRAGAPIETPTLLFSMR